MYRPEKIIDCHIHLITAETQRGRRAWLETLDERLRRAYHERWEQSLSARDEERPEPSPGPVAQVAERWEGELAAAGVARAVFFSSVESGDEIVRFATLKPDRFIGFTTFNPTVPQNAELLHKLVREAGIRGLKLYPMALKFRIDDPGCFPVYQACDELRLPVIIHFGLSINATHDLSYGNPMSLATPALRFPGVKWIIPHFGAGFYRETLLLAAQYGNVFVDTSSSNNWIRYSPAPVTLRDLFGRTCEALGAKRILFGSDSSFFPRGYRRNILADHLKTCNELGLSAAEIDDIFFNNIAEVLAL
ncbi:MAG: amidohydrolase family protein [Acidobacteriota bacterium]